MAKLIVRFYGRFAYALEHANGKLTGKISVIAPNFTPPLDRHRALMTVRRDSVVVDPDFTDVAPLVKIVADNADVLQAEMFVWDLEGLDAAFGGDDAGSTAASATLGLEDPRRIIFDLGDLVQEGGHRTHPHFDLNALHADRKGKAQAVVQVTKGKGTARKVLDIDSAFLVTHADATDKGPPDKDKHFGRVNPSTGEVERIDKADVVEFEIEVQPLEPFTLQLTDSATRRTGRVSIIAKTSSDTVRVNFSNLCSTLPREETYDLEFLQYYQLLQSPPDKQHALVPKPMDPGGETGECETKARITYDAKTGRSVGAGA